MKKSIGCFVIFFSFLVSLSTNINTVQADSVPGAVLAWGRNGDGQTNVPDGLGDVTAVAAGMFHTVALKKNGAIVVWGASGGNDFGQTMVPLGLNNVISIAAGQYHTAIVKSDGTVVMLGNNWFGQFEVPEGLSGVTKVVASGFRTLALKSDGTVVEWGNNDLSQERVPVGLGGVVAIAAGPGHSIALKSDGTVVAWGWNGYGQTNVPDGLNNVVAIAAGIEHSVALKSDGTIVTWGRNDFNELTAPTGLTGVVAIAAGYGNTSALKSDGTVISWGRNDFGQTSVPAGLGRVTSIAAGPYHTVAIISADVTPPTITTPDNILVSATSPAGASVSYFVSVIDNVTDNPAVSCIPTSGSIFPIGVTTVMCTATDMMLNSTVKSFTVTVLTPVQMITGLAQLVGQINGSQGIINSLDTKLQNAIASLDAMKVSSATTACNQLGAFVSNVQAQTGKVITVDQANQLIVTANQIRSVIACAI